MARVTATEVRAIFDTTMLDAQLDAFIVAADMMIDRLLLDQGYSDSELKEIARWLSAHFAVAREKPIKSESIGGVSNSYDTSVGMGLDGSFYGQHVKLLDTQGILVGREKRRAQVSWVGTK